MPLSPRRVLCAVAVFSAMPLLVACPKKDVPVVIEAGPPPVVEEASTTVLVPLEEDAGTPDADAAPPKYTGAAVNPNVARIKACCNQLRAESKRQNNPPEFGAAIATCDQLAAAAGTSGSAPELSAIKGLLAGRTLPAACQ